MEHKGTVTLKTDRLTLRKFELSDAEPMYKNWANDPQVTKFLTWKPHKDVNASRQIIGIWTESGKSPDFYQWAIVSDEINEPIGSISAVKIDERTDSVTIGYCIGKKWWGQGIIAEALSAVIKFFFEEVGASVVNACHDPHNPNSGRVMQKCGMRYEGTWRRAGVNNQGICDESWYSILREEYFAAKRKKQMEITDKVHNGLYINLTNRCSCACTFCLRQTTDKVGESESLWLEREPTADEVIKALKERDLSAFSEIVFCGFGEPTYALPVLLLVAEWLKANTDLPLRINTNGQGSLINGYDISSDIAKYIDVVSVSLNHPDPVKYQQLVRSKFGDGAYPAMIGFAKSCAQKGAKVVMSTVDTTITHEEENRCREICESIGAHYRIRPWED